MPVPRNDIRFANGPKSEDKTGRNVRAAEGHQTDFATSANVPENDDKP